MSALSVRDLTFSRNRKAPVLHQVCMEVKAGEALCILGPNGAGKSSLLHCVLGIETTWSGEVRVMGHDTSRLPRRDVARLVSYVPQTSRSAFSFSVEEWVMMGRIPHIPLGRDPSSRDHAAVEDAMGRLGLLQLRGRPIDQLSGGELQLALTARALAQDTPVILLDEPTASLDLSNQARVLRAIRQLTELGRTVVITTHLPEHAFLLDARVLLLKQGEVIGDGAPLELCTQPVLSDLYGVAVQVLLHTGAGNPIAACIPTL
jgi:iron complex transport system ATP-binding protein